MAYFEFLPVELQAALKATADAIVAPGKGILAADESTGKDYCQIEFLFS